MKSEAEQFELKRELIRKRLLKYTRKAFRVIPPIDKPRILDIGCGSGIPTMALAELSDGEITALDIDSYVLDRLSRKVEHAGLSDRIKILEKSIFDMDFPNNSFDIIWSEGSIFSVGFEKGIREWSKFLRPGGFMVVHDATGDIKEKVASISRNGYRLLGYFELGIDIWQKEYFTPLEKLVDEPGIRNAEDSGLRKLLKQAWEEIDMFRNNPENNTSVCFIMQKE